MHKASTINKALASNITNRLYSLYTYKRRRNNNLRAVVNTIIWGFCKKNGHAIINELQKTFSVKLWISDAPSAQSIRDYLLGHIDNYKLNGTATETFQQFYVDHFLTFQIMTTRRGLHYSDLHELTNEFAMLYYHYEEFFLNERIELVIFANLPHEGPDYVLYQLAKRHGIKTLLCFQSIFRNRFFMTTSIEDFGHFKSIPAIFDKQEIAIKEGYHQDLFYMQTALKMANNYNQQKTHKGNTAYTFIKNSSKLFIKRVRFHLNMMTPTGPKKIIPRLHRHERQEQYKSSVTKAALSREKLENVLDGSKKVAYFPLHLQPELTTSALGGIYQDQLYAIEQLRKLLNDDWVIIVKENPKQSYYQRGELFFKRLSKIPHTYLVDKYFPSTSIMEKSQLTATITGTAGWETIKGGGKCLIFGTPWFLGLKNCLLYNSKTDSDRLESFLSEEHNFSKFHDSFNQMSYKMGIGVIDGYYAEQVPDYSPATNAVTVADSIRQVITNQGTCWN